MTRIFADSFYFIALLNPSDQFHTRAVDLARTLFFRLVTTSWILVELADALSAPPTRRLVHRFVRQANLDPNIEVIPADPAWLERGFLLYGDRRDKSWSLTDCISFEVMNELGLTDALTGDHHFEQAGFRIMFK